MAKITYEIDVNDKGLIDTLNKSSTAIKKTDNDIQKFGKSMSDSFAVFKGALAANVVSGAFNLVGKGIGSLVRSIGDFVNAANVQEDAVNRLNASLRNTGDFTEEASRDFQEFASTIQQSTIFGDEAILNQIALAKSFGASNEQAKKIAKTATELSAAFGIDLESATRNVAKSLGGYAGELGEVIPELKNLTQEQLRAGQGVDLIAAKFQGLAEAQTKTFSGATQQLTNTFGDLQETIGSLITQNPVLIQITSALSEAFVSVGEIIQKNKPIITAFFNSFLESLISAIKPVGLLVTGVIRFGDVVKRVFYGGRALIMSFIQTMLQGVRGAFNAILKVKQFLGQATTSTQRTIDLLSGQIEAFSEGAVEDFDEFFKDDTVGDFNKTILKTADIVQNKLTGSFKEAKMSSDSFKSSIQKVEIAKKESIKNTQKKIEVTKELTTAQKEQLTGMEKLLSKESLMQQAGSLASGLGQGAPGAANVLAGAGGAVAEAYLPGLGQVVQPLLQLMFKDPKTVKGYVQGFVRAIPDIIENLIENMPLIIDVLIEEVPRITDKMVETLPPVLARTTGRALEQSIRIPLKMLESGIRDISKLFSKAFGGFFKGLKNAGSQLFNGIKNAGSNFFKFIIRGAKTFISKLIEGIKNALPKVKFGGGKGGGLGVDLGFAKFAEGGSAFVKSVPPGFNDDTFNARLTSGELVVDRSTAKKLKFFLDNVDSFLQRSITIGLDAKAERVLTVSQNESSALGLSRGF